LTKNEIKRINKFAFNGLNLKSLDLSNQNLTKIINETFQGLLKLKQLDLRYNKLYELEDESFNGLSSLVKLTLDFNSINVIKLRWPLIGIFTLEYSRSLLLCLIC